MHRSAPTFTGLFHGFRAQTAIMEALTGTYGPFRTQKLPDCYHFWAKQALLEFDCNLCTVLYFEHIGEGLKAVFDAAESPLQAALPQG